MSAGSITHLVSQNIHISTYDSVEKNIFVVCTIVSLIFFFFLILLYRGY